MSDSVRIRLGSLYLRHLGYAGIDTAAPARGERVRLMGRSGTFVVVSVDERIEMATVGPLPEPAEGLEKVPLAAILRMAVEWQPESSTFAE